MHAGSGAAVRRADRYARAPLIRNAFRGRPSDHQQEQVPAPHPRPRAPTHGATSPPPRRTATEQCGNLPTNAAKRQRRPCQHSMNGRGGARRPRRPLCGRGSVERAVRTGVRAERVEKASAQKLPTLTKRNGDRRLRRSPSEVRAGSAARRALEPISSSWSASDVRRRPPSPGRAARAWPVRAWRRRPRSRRRTCCHRRPRRRHCRHRRGPTTGRP